MLLEGKTALITGITRGIGRAIAEAFAAQGARIAGVYTSSEAKAREMEQLLREQNRLVKLYKGDVADREFALSTVNDVVATTGRLDILVNNAGITRDGYAMRLSDKEWHDVIDTHVNGTFNFMQAALTPLLAQGQGCVINLASVVSVLGFDGQANYGAAKGAITGLTRLFARQYSPRGIRFNLLAPGLIDTDMLSSVPSAKVDNFVKHTAMQRLGTAEDVAGVATFLASDLARYMSTNALRVDGGFLR
jgi:3-oxoacyl-[acyl-carrier protein] reductase